MTIPSVFTKVDSLQRVLHDRTDNKKIALVPTMGALHHGHMELVRRAFELADLVVVSIFINPKQFNKEEDLEKYPKMLEKDLELLRKEGDVIVFNPEVSEIYPKNYEAMKLDLGPIATTMEGEFRPGHFDGVVMVGIDDGNRDLPLVMVMEVLVCSDLIGVIMDVIWLRKNVGW